MLFGSLVGNSRRRIGNLIPTLVVDQWKIPLYATVARNRSYRLRPKHQKGPFRVLLASNP